MLALTNAKCDSDKSLKANSLMNDGRANVVPIKAESYPIMHDAKLAIAADAYTFQLYTALGVGRSSTRVRKPPILVTDLR